MSFQLSQLAHRQPMAPFKPVFTPGQQEAVARLEYAFGQGITCATLAGTTGTGKTLLAHYAAARATRCGHDVHFLDAVAWDGFELAWRLAERAGLSLPTDVSTPRLWMSLEDYYLGTAKTGQSIAVIIDHFEHVEYGCGQTLRRLLRIANRTMKRMSVVLVLREPATAPTSVLIAEISELKINLGAWNLAEASLVVQTLLDQRTSPRKISEPALATLHRASRGVPADLIRLCELSLLGAEVAESNVVDESIAELIVAEFQQERPFAQVSIGRVA